MQDAVTAIIAECFDLSPGQVTDDLSYGALPEWDSFGHLSLIVSLEEKLRVSINDEMTQQLTSVAAIRKFVRAHHSDASSFELSHANDAK